jgi:ribosome biogenesis GTPase
MMTPAIFLAQLGWRPFFSEQVSADEERCCLPVRVMSVHRGTVTVAGAGSEESVASTVPGGDRPGDRPTVGDWLLIDRDSRSLVRILDRTSLIKRPAPGDDRRIQLIAANIDTLFVVTSCDQDFNVARIERFLVLAREVGVPPVVVLTKADLTPAPERFVEDVRALEAGLRVELVNGRDPASASSLSDYCGVGKTVALVGSSGVGKSTLVNTLLGSDDIATSAVREDDGKGRHTTTVREMHRLPGGGWLVDTPGIRELQMSEVASGVIEVFEDVTNLALECQFTNCAHAAEPGCAIRAAIDAGTLDPARVQRWRKLAQEDAANSAVSAIRRSRRRTQNRR